MTIIGIVSRPNKSILGKSNTMVLDDIRRAVIKFNCVPISVLPTQDIEYYNKRLNMICSSSKDGFLNVYSLPNKLITTIKHPKKNNNFGN